MSAWSKIKKCSLCLQVLILLAIGLSPREALGENILILQDQHIAEPIGQFLGSVLVPDDGRELSAQERSRLVLTPNTKNYFDGGFGDGRVWVQLKILNPASQSRRIFLEHRDVFVPSVRLIADDSGYSELATMDSFQGSFRHNYHLHVFQVDVKPGLNTYWIEIRGIPKRLKLYLWDEESFLGRGLREHTILMVCMALPLVLILYEILLFLTNPDRLRLFYIATLSAVAAASFISNGTASVFLPANVLPWLYTKGIYSAYLIVSIFGPHFTVQLFVRRLSPSLEMAYRTWLTINGLVLLLIQFVPFQSSFVLIVLAPLIGIGIAIAALVQGAKSSHRQALYVILGTAPVILGTLYSLALLVVDLPIVSFQEMLLQGELTAFAIGLSMAVGRDIQVRQEAAAQEIDQLNQELRRHVLNVEDIVAEKAAKIQSILKNIKQGIFTIDRKLGMDSEHSEFLEQIFHVSDIDSMDPIDLLYQGAADKHDEMAKLRSALLIILGEDLMAFEINQDAFPSEIVRQLPEGETQILECEFNPILDAHGITDRILVCVRDVTETRKLLLQTATQREATQILSELIAVDPMLFHRFMQQARDIAQKGQRFLGPVDADDLQELFISAHTLKGLARSLNLGLMTEHIHLIESALAEFESKSKAHGKDGAGLQSALTAFENLLERYHQMSANLHDPHRGPVQNQQQRLEIKRIFDSFTRLSPPSQASQWVDYEYVKNSLAAMCLVPAEGLIEEVRTSIKRLAGHLQKPEPVFEVLNESTMLTPEQDIALRNIFLHLIRNAIDHGIEPLHIRQEKGKSSAGRIQLKIVEEQDHIIMDFSDDGHGLDLERIRHGAVKQGLLSASTPMTREDIAELIFSPGFSTAERVNDISGRGIGMLAVRRMLEGLGGHIEIVLAPSQTEVVPFHFRLHFPKQLKTKTERAA